MTLAAALAACVLGPDHREPTATTSEAVTAGSAVNNTCGAALYTWSSPWGSVSAFSNAGCSGNAVECNTGCGLNSCGCIGTYGYQYQCVELVTRFFVANMGNPRVNGNAGTQMCGNYAANAAYSVYYPGGGGPEPVPGDALVWSGHTALIVDATTSSLGYMQQNYGNASGWQQWTDNVSWNGSTFGNTPNAETPVCWVHAKNNTASVVAYPKFVRRTPVDVNGDGDADVCARASGGVICQVSNGTGFPTAVKGPLWSDASGWASPQFGSTVQFADINGDGKADVCGRAVIGVLCELSDGNGFPTAVTGPAWGDTSGWSKPEYYSTIQFADVNGDGKADICARAGAGIICSLSDGNGFPTPVTGPAWSDASGWSKPEYYSSIQFADVNGDGKADVCARAGSGVICNLSDGTGFPTAVQGPLWGDASGWAKPEFGSTIQLVDVNGDGKADVCGRAALGILCELSDGKSFPTEIKGPAWSDANGWSKLEYYSTIQFADINGDGKADVCGRAGAGVICNLSDGNGFPTLVTGPAWSDTSGWADPKYDSTIAFADVNHDGKDDVCARASAGMLCSLSTGTAFGPSFAGPSWSDASGWGGEPYYSSIRLLGVAHPSSAKPPPGDAGVPDVVVPPPPSPPGTPSPPSPSQAQPGGAVGSSGGCSIARRQERGGLAILGVIAALAFRRRRRREACRSVSVAGRRQVRCAAWSTPD